MIWNQEEVNAILLSMLDIYKYGDDVLYQTSEEVRNFDSALKMLVDAMFDTLYEADGVGLAGPQVGVSQRLFVVDTGREGERIAFINPQIIESSDDSVPYEEGCLSVPGVYHDVMRPSKVTVQAQDVNGKRFLLNAQGLLARVIQHENDHLNGKLFIDRLDEKEREKILIQYEKKNRRKAKKK